MQLQPEAFFFKGVEDYYFNFDGVNDRLDLEYVGLQTVTEITFFMAFKSVLGVSAGNLGYQGISNGPTHFFRAEAATPTTLTTFLNTRGYVSYPNTIIDGDWNYIAISRSVLGNAELINANGVTGSSTFAAINAVAGDFMGIRAAFSNWPAFVLKEYAMIDYAMNASELANMVTNQTADAGTGSFLSRVFPSYPTTITSLDPAVTFTDELGNTCIINGGKPNPMVLGVDLVKI